MLANTPHLERSATILASMSPDMVADIITLVNTRGGNLVNDLFNQNSPSAGGATGNRFLAIASREYISDADFDSVWVGLSTVFLHSLRNPALSNDNYQDVLEKAFSLPPEIAEPMAKRIDTYDILGPKDPSTDALLDKIGRNLFESARRASNWAAGIVGLDWEIDQQQNYDFDFLYEMKLLGDAVNELNSRARLMNAQALISAQMSILQTGDAEDGDSADQLVGDAMRPFGYRNLPAAIFGASTPAFKLGMKASTVKANQVFDQAGVKHSKGGSTITQAKHPKLAAALRNIVNMKPGKAALIGGIAGLVPSLIAGIKNAHNTGDPDLYGDASDEIGEVYGPSVANDVRNGDFSSLGDAILTDHTDDYITGDADIDMIGDPDPEIGGPFRRLRQNIARRRAAKDRRRIGRADMKYSRQHERQTRRLKKQQHKTEQMEESFKPGEQEEEQQDPIDMSMGQDFSDAPEANQNEDVTVFPDFENY